MRSLPALLEHLRALDKDGRRFERISALGQ
jgi:hypothetical protein